MLLVTSLVSFPRLESYLPLFINKPERLLLLRMFIPFPPILIRGCLGRVWETVALSIETVFRIPFLLIVSVSVVFLSTFNGPEGLTSNLDFVSYFFTSLGALAHEGGLSIYTRSPFLGETFARTFQPKSGLYCRLVLLMTLVVYYFNAHSLLNNCTRRGTACSVFRAPLGCAVGSITVPGPGGERASVRFIGETLIVMCT